MFSRQKKDLARRWSMSELLSNGVCGAPTSQQGADNFPPSLSLSFPLFLLVLNSFCDWNRLENIELFYYFYDESRMTTSSKTRDVCLSDFLSDVSSSIVHFVKLTRLLVCQPLLLLDYFHTEGQANTFTCGLNTRAHVSTNTQVKM